jgi:HSP20 family protein
VKVSAHPNGQKVVARVFRRARADCRITMGKSLGVSGRPAAESVLQKHVSSSDSRTAFKRMRKRRVTMAAPLIRRLRDEQPLLDEIEAVYEIVRKRAFELFRNDESRSTIENWLQAEREMIWKPPIELVAKNNSYILQTPVPGLDAGDIEIQVSKGLLVIKAKKAHEHHEQDENTLRCEYSCGKLFREVELPEDADLDSASAKLDKGVLTITFSPVGAAPRKVPVSRVPVGVGNN